MTSPADQLRERLAYVLDPELGASIVELGMVGAISVADGHATVEVALTTAACPLRSQIERDVTEAALVVDGIATVSVVLGTMEPAAKAALMDTARRLAQESAPTTTIARSTPVLAISSGKGGVGKSSVTANLAVALAQQGYCVGVLDADIWGFSLPRLLGMTGDVTAKAGKMQPLEKQFGDGSIRLLSMGFLADEEKALLWRGLIVQKAVQQFIEDANWSGVDYFIIDTPPGTGDISMTLARILPHMSHVIVTTPAMAAQRVAARMADFARRSNVRVVGVVENMAPFHCECGITHDIFGSGGGDALAEELHTPLLASIPLRPHVAAGGDAGLPAVGSDPVIAQIFGDLVERIVADIAPPAGMTGCTARMMQGINAALNDR